MNMTGRKAAQKDTEFYAPFVFGLYLTGVCLHSILPFSDIFPYDLPRLLPISCFAILCAYLVCDSYHGFVLVPLLTVVYGALTFHMTKSIVNEADVHLARLSIVLLLLHVPVFFILAQKGIAFSAQCKQHWICDFVFIREWIFLTGLLLLCMGSTVLLYHI